MTMKKFRKQLMGNGISRNDANEACHQISNLLANRYNFDCNVHGQNYLEWLTREIKKNPGTPVWTLVC